MAGNADFSKNNVKERLLDAGEVLFSEKGFDGASTRGLTLEAGCNVAAVNYHFGGKYELYREVVRRRVRQMRDARIERLRTVVAERGDDLALEDVLMTFATAFIEPLVNESQGRRFMRIIGWEMIEGRLPKQELYDEMIKPVVTQMTELFLRLFPGMSERAIFLCIASIIGQLLHTVHVYEAFKEEGVERFGSVEMNSRVEHIVKFSAAGIRACAGA